MGAINGIYSSKRWDRKKSEKRRKGEKIKEVKVEEEGKVEKRKRKKKSTGQELRRIHGEKSLWLAPVRKKICFSTKLLCSVLETITGWSWPQHISQVQLEVKCKYITNVTITKDKCIYTHRRFSLSNYEKQLSHLWKTIVLAYKAGHQQGKVAIKYETREQAVTHRQELKPMRMHWNPHQFLLPVSSMVWVSYRSWIP